MIYRMGDCNNCGRCCYLYKGRGVWEWCPHYNHQLQQHCTIWEHRPQRCRAYPRGPMDLERVADVCSYRFVDEHGRVVDPYMDRRVRLTPFPRHSH